ncbi:MAG: helix-turn-helix domain-containing protein [Sphingobacterium sp.]|jgi:AraC-like DNA-binding protein|uniref:helix-turn-helix domain-containing protein n=1 Tax=unclassified Sphingobacterium TaxID=2609468 RepID=UPI00283E857B|nr:helix-turn-helix domain-containing protein [Sphingobacterium sp.]MDR3008257.1 helix-turn-helix domain-containing protein [Sphingobacterium sp.]
MMKSETRGAQITKQYLLFLDKHIDDVFQGQAMEFMAINKIAREIAVSPKHLSYTVQKEKGKHPGYFYNLKIIAKAKELLINSPFSIAKISLLLTYDASNFSKFFKKCTGETPGSFRKKQHADL